MFDSILFILPFVVLILPLAPALMENEKPTSVSINFIKSQMNKMLNGSTD